MTNKPKAGSSRILAATVVAAAVVMIWKVVGLALLQARSEQGPLFIPALLAAAGMTFLACGLTVFLKLPGRSSLLFAWFCICTGLHWGGPLELAPGDLRTALILFYLLVSGILAAIFLLHLALEFPLRSPMADRGALVGLLYLPAGLAAVLMAISLASPSGGELRATTQEWFLILHTMVTNLFSLLALVLFTSRLLGKRLSTSQKSYVGVMVAGMLLAWLPYLVASSLGVENTDPWNLTVVALPLSFTLAFFRIGTARDAGTTATAGSGSGSKTLTSIILLAVLAGAQGSAPAAHPPESEMVLPSEICRGLYLIPVTFGEREGTTLNLLLDTGASRTFLDPGVLHRIAGGNIQAGKVSFKSARIGRHELGPLRAYVLPLKKVSLGLGREIDGILGFPAFGDVLLTLDYPAEQVRISAGRLPRPDGVEIFRAPGKRPHLDVGIGKRRVKLLLDSGYTGRFQFQEGDVAAWSAEPRLASSQVGAAGLVIHEGGRLDGPVRFGPLDFENPVVILGKGERLAGWHVLRHFVLTFDQKTNRMQMTTASASPVSMSPLAGTGMTYDPRPDGLRVVRVSPGSSAEAAGLLAQDLITAIDGTPVHSRGCADARSGTVGQQQVFTYMRDGRQTQATIETEIIIP